MKLPFILGCGVAIPLLFVVFVFHNWSKLIKKSIEISKLCLRREQLHHQLYESKSTRFMRKQNKDTWTNESLITKLFLFLGRELGGFSRRSCLTVPQSNFSVVFLDSISRFEQMIQNVKRVE